MRAPAGRGVAPYRAMSVRAEQLTEPVAAHGEGPVWHPGWGGLRWVDMLAGDVLHLDSGGRVHRKRVGTVAAALRPRTSGGAVIAVERGFALLESGVDGFGDDTPPRPLGELWTDPTIRMNEGGCSPDGEFYCGTMDYDAAPGRGTLYTLDVHGEVRTALDGVTISNGLAWSPDGGTAYYVDTPTRRIDAFDYDGTLTARRTVVTIPEDAGSPDGLTVDSQGYLWVALWGGSAVRRYSPAGVLDEAIELPVSQVTACTLGGPDLDLLFITTSQLDVSGQPQAGALFVVSGCVPGLPVLPYGG